MRKGDRGWSLTPEQWKARQEKATKKIKAKQLPLPEIPAPKMGRPVSGNAKVVMWMSEFHALILADLAKSADMTPGRWLETVIQIEWDNPRVLIQQKQS